MEDTDMASPPNTFHASSHSVQSSQPTSSSQQPQRSKSRTIRTVNDGYIYQSYDNYTSNGTLETDRETPASRDDGSQAASATRILELRGLERRIVQLLETAGQAIQILSGDEEDDDPENEETGKRLLSAASLAPDQRQAMIKAYADERSKQFETLAAGYATLVNEIQAGLRRQFHYLTKAGIASETSQVPFKNVVYGEEKELETWLNAVDVLKDSANALIGKVEKDLLEPREASITAAESAASNRP
ncbi:hypothetical protein BGZ99_009997 [Dissophora globulifera]|uniref:Mediator of RNA polymerase II transcription subunit 11 n=1 Tax=Dissophora globulifera TaxID=979702 RepID=A0A9P6UMH6_9FUNG|nr:hypothetical protein BGZ99_009997 [Dissophora globulifera]